MLETSVGMEATRSVVGGVSREVRYWEKLGMSIGQRVKAIQQLADYLFDLPTSDDATMVLLNYGAEAPETWSHFRSYLLLALNTLEDQRLLGMARDLLPSSQSLPITAEDLPWQPGFVRLFVSHSSVQKTEVGQLRTELAKYSVDAFVAHDAITPTLEWLRVIVAALETCDAFAAWLTPAFRQSNWTDQEVGYAFSREVPIVPIKADGTDPYGFIGKFQAVGAAPGNPAITAARIVDAMSKHPHLQARMLNVALTRFEQAANDAEAKEFVLPLQHTFWSWSPDALDRLERAADNNSQIRDAYGVADKIGAIVAKHKRF